MPGSASHCNHQIAPNSAKWHQIAPNSSQDRPHAPVSQHPDRHFRSDAGLRELLSRIPDKQPAARAVLALLHTYARQDGEAWPSQATLARATGLSERTVQRAVAYLHLARLIDVWRRHPARSGNAYRVLYPARRPATKTPPRPQPAARQPQPHRTYAKRMAPWPQRPLDHWPHEWVARHLRRARKVYGRDRVHDLDLWIADQRVQEFYPDARPDEHARLCFRILERHARHLETLPRDGPTVTRARRRKQRWDDRQDARYWEDTG